MKGSILEPTLGLVQFDEARVAFKYAVFQELPATALDEVRELARGERSGDLDASEAWVKKWNVDAPFMRLDVQRKIDDVRCDPEKPENAYWERDSQGVELPGWNHQIETWNQMSVSGSPEMDVRLADGKMWLTSDRNPDMQNVVVAPRERLLQQAHIIAPIATDPTRESLPAFLERARYHWQARAQVGERHYRFSPVAATQECERDARWTARHQIHGTPFREIAEEARTTTDAVRNAIKRFTERIDLRPRASQRGRPRRVK